MVAISGGQQRQDWYAIPGVPLTLILDTADGSAWPSAPRVLVGPVEADGDITPVLAPLTAVVGSPTSRASLTLTDAQMATILTAYPVGSRTACPWHVRLGTGEAEVAVSTGYLIWDTIGHTVTTSATLVVGPAGPTAVSTDVGNVAELGTDGLLFVSPTAGSAHVIQDEGTPLTNRAGLNFAGAGVTVTDDAGNGRTLVTIPASGGVSDHGALTGLADDDHSQYHTDARGDARYSALGHTHSGTYAPASHTHAQSDVTGLTDALAGKASALGVDDNYVTDAEKAKLANLSGTNTGDQTLPTWSTIAGKPAVVAEGATQGDARTAIGAGTSSFDGVYASLTSKPTLGSAAATASSDYATAAQGALAASALQPATAQAINAQTGTTYTLVAGDAGKLVTLDNTGAITLNAPGSTFTAGQRVDVLVLNTGMATVVGTSGASGNSTPSLVSRARYSAFTVVWLTATTFVVVGDLA